MIFSTYKDQITEACRNWPHFRSHLDLSFCEFSTQRERNYKIKIWSREHAVVMLEKTPHPGVRLGWDLSENKFVSIVKEALRENYFHCCKKLKGIPQSIAVYLSHSKNRCEQATYSIYPLCGPHVKNEINFQTSPINNFRLLHSIACIWDFYNQEKIDFQEDPHFAIDFDKGKLELLFYRLKKREPLNYSQEKIDQFFRAYFFAYAPGLSSKQLQVELSNRIKAEIDKVLIFPVSGACSEPIQKQIEHKKKEIKERKNSTDRGLLLEEKGDVYVKALGDAYVVTVGPRIAQGIYKNVYKGLLLTESKVTAISIYEFNKNNSQDIILREVSLAAEFKHVPHVLSILDSIICFKPGVGCVLEQYAPLYNGDLGEEVQSVLSEKLLTQAWLDAAKGLKYFHENLLVYSDFKPKNIFFKLNENKISAVIGDIASAVREGSGRAGISTILYSSPEMLQYEMKRFALPFRPHDIWSFGIVLLEYYFKISVESASLLEIYHTIAAKKNIESHEGLKMMFNNSKFTAALQTWLGEIKIKLGTLPPTPLADMIRTMLYEEPGIRPKIDAVITCLQKHYEEREEE